MGDRDPTIFVIMIMTNFILIIHIHYYSVHVYEATKQSILFVMLLMEPLESSGQIQSQTSWAAQENIKHLIVSHYDIVTIIIASIPLLVPYSSKFY